ncbi:hypothetical protein TSUD_16890 [Trifolium subterraneum]|uniref:Uncharacterized protein n=1 Tax=Trifolium subterraneum TaxID=3900 RepID=A0A2Z6M1F0_TRISU|nr:hypothetical protein TSUD_16890 [Trifolium subterraneum]
MDTLNSILFILFTFIFLKFFHSLLSKHKPPLPPGPRGLPIIVYSVDLVGSSDKAGEFKEFVTKIMKEVGRVNIADCFPILKVLDPIGIRRRVGEYFAKLSKIFGELVDERLKMRELKGYCRKSDMLDAMLDDENNIGEKYDDKIARLSAVCFIS